MRLINPEAVQILTASQGTCNCYAGFLHASITKKIKTNRPLDVYLASCTEQSILVHCHDHILLMKSGRKVCTNKLRTSIDILSFNFSQYVMTFEENSVSLMFSESQLSKVKEKVFYVI